MKTIERKSAVFPCTSTEARGLTTKNCDSKLYIWLEQIVKVPFFAVSPRKEESKEKQKQSKYF